MIVNPFEIKTPEQNSAQDVVDLFVNVFADFKQVLEKGHTFLNGPRGSGKSMMFRYIQPDCQKIVSQCSTSGLDYFSVYIPIKLTNINISDLDRLEEHAENIINEHLLSTYVVSNIFMSLDKSYGDELNVYTSDIRIFYDYHFKMCIKGAGYTEELPSVSELDGRTIVRNMAQIVSLMNKECLQYCRSIALSRDLTMPYNGAITDFIDFVYPILIAVKDLPFFPKDKPFFILIDDAGYLNLSQTKILNTWVSYRTTKDVCFKISTQLDYKTHLTTNGKRIDAPHDYSEINISTIYASSKSKYYDRIKEIVERRLTKYLSKDIDAIDYFPEKEEQRIAIAKLYEEIKTEYSDPQKKYAGVDAAKRYSRPEYIRRLQQHHKAGHTYSYAGFDQLVAISSGIIRQFLAPAQEMFSQASLEPHKEYLEYMHPSIQDNVIKKYSDAFLSAEIDKIRKDVNDDKENLIKIEKLYNLIDSLGELFHMILVSKATERRVFSVALTDTPDEELREILEMGEQYGYIHKSSIGNKQGTGRNRLYILSRILAPHFKLDPTSFAGYKFMKSDVLKLALTNKSLFLKTLSKNITNDIIEQPTLFDLFDDLDS